MRGPFCRGVKFVFQKSTYKRGEVTTGPRVVPKAIKTGRPEREIFFHHPVMPSENFASEVVAPPQRPSAAILYSNPHGCPCTLTGVLHG